LSIETYLQALLDTVATAPDVATADVALDKRGPQAGLIRGDITFVDGALLHFRELIDLESKPPRLMYSYHYQRADASLVFRYDDTPHHPEVSTFPHHKHQLAEQNALAVEPPTLATVLDEIGRIRADQE
jgi:hypothetical protein